MTNMKFSEPVALHPVLHLKFANFTQMKEYGKRWEFFDIYRFGTQPFNGQYNIYMDEDIQVAHAVYRDGLMYRGHAPKEAITLTLFMEHNGSLTANHKLLCNGEILILDDTTPFEIAFSKYSQKGVVSLSKTFVDTHFPYLNEMIGQVYIDKYDILRSFILQTTQTSVSNQIVIHSELLTCFKRLSLEKQNCIPKQLTKKESCVFDVRDFMIEHLEENFKIEEIAKHFSVSERTLQTAFKRIFGYTPKKFMKLLKYNKAYTQLVTQYISVSQVALQYGFGNFGLFSAEFKKMFGKLPSEVQKSNTCSV